MVRRLLLLAFTAAGQPAFEVTSVRPAVLSDGGTTADSSIRVDPDRFAARSVNLLTLVLQAYRITSCGGTGEYGCSAVAGGPDWLQKHRFDVQAQIPEGTPAHSADQLTNGHAPELARMLEGLLVDRFRFKAHREKREMPIYALTVSPKGHKLGLSTASSEEPHLLVSPSETNGQRSFRFEAINTSVGELCDFFSGCMNRPMIDRTGISGKFHFTVTYDANPLVPGAFTELAGPELFRALQDQLGLKVMSTRGMVEVLVIDHVERPTAN